MKRLLLMTMLSFASVSLAGCGGRLWNWFHHNGAPCNSAYGYSGAVCDSTQHASLYEPSGQSSLQPYIQGVTPGPVEVLPPPNP